MSVDPSILEAMLNAEAAPEPGTFTIKDVIHKGDIDLPAPIVAAALESAGYSYIYNTETGDRSLTNNNMLGSQLGKRREDGSRVFSTIPPTKNGKVIKPKAGTFKCLLHADSNSRKEYDELGLPVCPKANLTSRHQVTMHMQHRHKAEWATIEQERVEDEKKADREFQRGVIAMADKGK